MAYLSPLEMARIVLMRPEVRVLVLPLMQATEDATGKQIRVVSGQRSYDEQAALHLACQNGTGSCPAAPPGQSKHEYGSAFDIEIVGGTDADYQKLADLAQSSQFGLKAGYYFHTTKDPGHIESAESLADCEAAFLAVDDERRDTSLTIIGSSLAVLGAAWLAKRTAR